MRKLFLAAFLLASCGGGGDEDSPPLGALTTPPSGSAELLALRVPLGGGRGRVLRYPALDSTVWSSRVTVPAIAKVLSFDVEGGTLLYVDTRGAARSLDFRLGAITPATRLRLTRHITSDAWNVYGVSDSGTVGRSTPLAILGGSPVSAWSFKGSLPVIEVFPQQSGALLVVGRSDSSTIIWRVYPPEEQAADSVVLPNTGAAFRTSAGDRLYLSTGSGLLGISTRDLQQVERITVKRGVRQVVPTPSGNQLFVSGDSSDRVNVVDRYKGRVARTIRFPGAVMSLRMDSHGRFILARPFEGDSAWVVPLSDLGSIRRIETVWREDLPQVAWDGAIVTARERDLVILDPTTLDPHKTIRGGAADFWYLFAWKGFRPSPARLPDHLAFAGPIEVDTTEYFLARRSGVDDSVPPVSDDPGAARQRAILTLPTKVESSARLFTVSFAVLRNEGAAIELARTIRVRGQVARVVADVVDATQLYRVVLGPFRTRDEAERVGRQSGRSYWVYQGSP